MKQQPANQNGLKPKPSKITGRKILGIFLIIAPIVGLTLIFTAYAIAGFAVSQIAEPAASDIVIQNTNINTSGYTGLGTQDIRAGVMSVVNAILGFLGILCVIGIIIGIPVGIILIAKGAGEKKFFMKEAINFGWATMKNNFFLFAGLIAVSAFIRFLPAIAGWLTGEREDLYLLNFGIIIIAWILGLIITVGWINIGLKFVDNKPVKFTDLFPSIITVGKYFLSSILFFLIMSAGFILFIIPGIIWSIKFQLYSYFIVEGAGPIEAIKKSGRATQGAKADLLVFGILLGLINFVGALALLLGLFAAIPTTVVAMAFVYRQLQKQMSDASNTTI